MLKHLARAVLLLLFGIQAPNARSQSETYIEPHVEWSILHEGCDVYAGTVVRPLQQLRECFIKAELHNPQVAQVLQRSEEAELKTAINQALQFARGKHHIEENFEWVLSHEKQLGLFRELSEAGNYDQIRKIYRELQSHNPDARNILSALSDNEIRDLLFQTRYSVRINVETSYETLKNIDSITIPQIVTVPSNTVLSSLLSTAYGFSSASLARVVTERNPQLSADVQLDPGHINVPSGMKLTLPSIPHIGSVGTVRKIPLSGASCPLGMSCTAEYTADTIDPAIFAEAEIKTKGDGQIEQDVSGHIENPAGQLQSVNAPTVADYGWYLDYLGLDQIDQGNVSLISPVLIGVIDSGVDTGDDDLMPFFWSTPSAIADLRWTAGAIGYDFLRMNTDPWDEMPISHGTHVSGLVIGQQVAQWLPSLSQNLIGKLKLVELKVAGSHGTLDSATAQNAVLGGIAKGVRLFNLSFELGAYSEMLRDYLADAGRSSNSLYIVAAGNKGAITHGESLDSNTQRHMTFRRDDSLPLADVIFVAALDHDGKIAGFSNYGPKTVEIAAPGVDISSTIRNGGHGLLSGTSQAAPFVTLTAAILMAEFPSMSLPEVHQRIVDTCDWRPELKAFVRDGCRLNVLKAVISNADLVELKSGKILKGTVSAAQIPLPAGTNTGVTKYERAWFADDGTITIATTTGRFTTQALSASSLIVSVQSAAECVGQMSGADCAVPIGQVRDVVFRVSVQ